MTSALQVTNADFWGYAEGTVTSSCYTHRLRWGGLQIDGG